MPDLLRESTPKARKVHVCGCCGAAAVQPGETYNRRTYVSDGMIYDWVTCLDCDALFRTVYDWSSDTDDGIGRDTYAEWAHDHTDDPTWGEKARAYLSRALGEKKNSDVSEA